MNRSRRKRFISREEHEGTGFNILRWDLVRDVYNNDSGINGKKRAFSRTNEIISRSEIGEQSNNGETGR